MNVNIYINWVLYAVYGLMSDADALRTKYADAIDAIAAELHQRHPLTPQQLYRGLLLEGAETLRIVPELTFVSWSEDRDVARWFGSPSSVISKPIAEQRPNVRGFVVTLSRPTARVLWHHSWRHAFGMPLERLALMHPLLGREGYRQVAWSLDTQREVITAPLDVTGLQPEAVEAVCGPSVAELDRRLSPPWINP